MEACAHTRRVILGLLALGAAEEQAMHEALADPSRLLGRGRGMAERLKQEEKVHPLSCPALFSSTTSQQTHVSRGGVLDQEEYHRSGRTAGG